MLVVVLDSSHNDFEIITTLFLYSGNKDLKEIEQIVTSIKIANMIKQTTG